jgi:hypothetical protein
MQTILRKRPWNVRLLEDESKSTYLRRGLVGLELVDEEVLNEV